jgi:hypothetical protein
VIENLGVTHVSLHNSLSQILLVDSSLYKDQHDCIDLTDNAIVMLANLPLLKRLRTLLLANNRVSGISPSLHISAPNLTSLILTNNNVSELGDLHPLCQMKSLRYLSLLSNPVREKKWYREWLIFSIKSLRVLDFQRIRDKVYRPVCLLLMILTRVRRNALMPFLFSSPQTTYQLLLQMRSRPQRHLIIVSKRH